MHTATSTVVFSLAWAVVLLGCALGGALAQGVDVTFTNETFSQNGTNLVARLSITQGYSAAAVNCTYTFPGDQTFLFINYYASSSFSLASDLSVRLTTLYLTVIDKV